MNIQPIAHFESPMKSKFGIPRQSGIVPGLRGRIIFEPAYRRMEAVRGLEAFDYIWLIWEFSGNRDAKKNFTVRPPRLGGNVRMGVFATRSPFRPNNLGLSCVRLERVEETCRYGPVVHVLGADLMDGTPIFDIKPYIPYVDAHPEASGGFVDTTSWQSLDVVIPKEIEKQLPSDAVEPLKSVLAQDPRPHYHDDADRVYGMPFMQYDIRFRVAGRVLTVTECVKI